MVYPVLKLVFLTQQPSHLLPQKVNKFGSQNRPDARKVLSRNDNDDDESLRFSSSTTMAVVTLNFAMMKQEEGNGFGDDAQGLPNNISTRSDLRRALRQISADAVVSDDRLLSAEILWLPEDSSETLSRDDVYADYPDLVPI